MHGLPARAFGATLLTALLIGVKLSGEPVPVRHPQGSAHGFLAVETVEGTRIATGDATQIVHGDRITSRVILRFVDGSIDEDITVFSQSGVFRLITDHHIQRGPSFPKPIDVLINALTGQITSRTEDGKLRQDHLDLPPDISKPRLIHVSVKPAGEVPFMIGETQRKAVDFVLHVELGRPYRSSRSFDWQAAARPSHLDFPGTFTGVHSRRGAAL